MCATSVSRKRLTCAVSLGSLKRGVSYACVCVNLRLRYPTGLMLPCCGMRGGAGATHDGSEPDPDSVGDGTMPVLPGLERHEGCATLERRHQVAMLDHLCVSQRIQEP